MADDDISARITVRIDREMREALDEMRKDHYERTGAMLENARLVRMLLRRAIGNDMDRSAVAEALLLTYRLNQVLLSKFIREMERNVVALIDATKEGGEEEPDFASPVDEVEPVVAAPVDEEEQSVEGEPD
jgi:hypothetical protein